MVKKSFTQPKGSLRERIRMWCEAEEGFSEAATLIIFLPFLAFILFALVETGIYMRYRIQVESVVQTTAMSIAQDGGAYWARTSPNGLDANNTWVDIGQKKLTLLCDGKDGSNAGDRCQIPPQMNCWIGDVGQSLAELKGTKRDGTGVTSNGSTMVQVAQGQGAPVYCQAVFHYAPVSSLSNNPETSVGLSGMFTAPITIGASSQTVVGWGG